MTALHYRTVIRKQNFGLFMPGSTRRGMPKYRLTVTRAGKKRYLISEKDTTALRERFNLNPKERLETKLKVGKVTFPVTETVEVKYPKRKRRGKGYTKTTYRHRIYLPAAVVKKAKLRKGRYTFETIPYQRGDVTLTRRNYNIARSRDLTTTKYFFIPFQQADPKDVYAEMYVQLYRKARQRQFVFGRLYYIAQDYEGNFSPIVFTTPQWDRSLFNNEEMMRVTLRRFVEEVYEKLGEILNRPSGARGIMFLKYSIHGVNLMGPTKRLEAIAHAQ